jgi:hypothetical protein
VRFAQETCCPMSTGDEDRAAEPLPEVGELATASLSDACGCAPQMATPAAPAGCVDAEQGNSGETRVAPPLQTPTFLNPGIARARWWPFCDARRTGTELSSPRVRIAATRSYGSSTCQMSLTPSQRSGRWWPRARSVGVPSRATRLRHERHPRRGHGLRRAKRLASQHRRRQAARPE